MRITLVLVSILFLAGCKSSTQTAVQTQPLLYQPQARPYQQPAPAFKPPEVTWMLETSVPNVWDTEPQQNLTLRAYIQPPR
jgi:hypothetical protein